jgi:hypothetical protein
MGYIVALVALVVLRVINRRVNVKGKGKKAVAVITMLVALVAGCGVAWTIFGEWIAAVVSWPGHALEHATHQSGWSAAIPIAATLLAVGVAIADIAGDKKADRAAQMAAVFAPILLYLVVGGVMGETGGDVVSTVNSNVGSFLASIGGSS